MNNKAVVNIVIPGAPKAGTTSISAFLEKHPDVFMPSLREPRFFIADIIKGLQHNDPLKKFLLKHSILDWNSYQGIYNSNKPYRLDQSVQYLYYHETAVPAIKQFLGDPHILIILRDPIKRAISNFSFNKNFEKGNSFVKVIQDELSGKRDNLNSFYHYYKQGLYYYQVKHFMENFSKVKVLFYEDFEKDNLEFVNDILMFLNLAPFDELPQLPKLNTSSDLTLPGKLVIGKYSLYNLANKYLLPYFFEKRKLHEHKLKLKAKYTKKTAKVTLTKDEHSFMYKLYAEDVYQLKNLLGIENLPWSNFKEQTNSINASFGVHS